MVLDLRRFDIYRKIPKDLTQPTWTGAIISVSCVFFIAFLFISELFGYLRPEIISELYVDDPVSAVTERIPVHLKISLPKLKCAYVGLDIQDDLGRHDVGFMPDTKKEDINEGAGCLFEASFNVNKVPGNFHVSTHSAGAQQPTEIDFTHQIQYLSIGSKDVNSNLPGSFNPLKDIDKTKSESMSTHDYFLKVVPTVYEDINGNKQHPYQYTYAHREYSKFAHGVQMGLPAIWFRYDMSPITVKYTERRKPFYSFLTTVCAIVGGTFTVAGIIDSCVFTATEVFRKAELGKLS